MRRSWPDPKKAKEIDDMQAKIDVMQKMMTKMMSEMKCQDKRPPSPSSHL